MRRLLALAPVLSLAACGGHALVAGQSTLDDVHAVMGTPAMQWDEIDGSRRLAYPRGPMGVHAFMVEVGPDGKLRRIENAMAPPTFAMVRPGMAGGDVQRLLGPPVVEWTAYFAARDELVWGWRYCDDWNHLARFFVLFDGTRRTVRSTMSLREDQVGNCGGDTGGCWCSR